MKKTLIAAAVCTTLMTQAENPFFKEFDTPYGTPPFNEIKFEHYEPAIRPRRQMSTRASSYSASAPRPTAHRCLPRLS